MMSRQSEAPLQTVRVSAEYSPAERSELLRLAHRAIDAVFEERRVSTKAPSEHFAQMRGAFTTLHLHGKLRGCVGYILPVYPLYQTVAETAVAAAFRDNRFPPVTRSEAPELLVEISVLSPLFQIAPENVVTGVHGLVVSMGMQRGLLLPQVPLEWGWDRETFLAQTCRKAGLPPDAWQRGATFEAFTAEVFTE